MIRTTRPEILCKDNKHFEGALRNKDLIVFSKCKTDFYQMLSLFSALFDFIHEKETWFTLSNPLLCSDVRKHLGVHLLLSTQLNTPAFTHKSLDYVNHPFFLFFFHSLQDLVKSHLLFAVREEVEVLKVQIKELGEQNDALLRENQMLRQTNPQAVAQHNLPNPPSYANTTQTLPPPTQGQTISPPQGQQQQLHGMSMQHQQGLPPPQQQQQSQLPPQGSQLPPQGSQHAMSIPQQQQMSQQQQASQPPQQQQQQGQPPQQQQLQMPLQQHSIPNTQQAGALPPQQQSQHAQQQAVPQQQSHPAKT